MFRSLLLVACLFIDAPSATCFPAPKPDVLPISHENLKGEWQREEGELPLKLEFGDYGRILSSEKGYWTYSLDENRIGIDYRHGGSHFQGLYVVKRLTSDQLIICREGMDNEVYRRIKRPER